MVVELAEAALEHYALTYARHTPSLLFDEVHAARAHLAVAASLGVAGARPDRPCGHTGGGIRRGLRAMDAGSGCGHAHARPGGGPGAAGRLRGAGSRRAGAHPRCPAEVYLP